MKKENKSLSEKILYMDKEPTYLQVKDVKEFIKWLLEEQWDMDISVWKNFVEKVKERAGKNLI